MGEGKQCEALKPMNSFVVMYQHGLIIVKQYFKEDKKKDDIEILRHLN